LGLAVAVPASRGGACSSGFCSLPVVSRNFVLLASAAALPAQVWRRDPLTDDEADKLREAAEEPNKRLFLLVEFATARMAKVDEARTQLKPAATHAQRIHDALDDFGRVMDEIDDNVDDYENRKMDMRKGLAALIEADTAFQSKLAQLATEAANANGTDHYQFVLEDDLDIVKSQLERAREVLQEQEHQIKEEKARQKQRERQTYNPLPITR
jgi:septal ring factor EnvC (AmiA/AmiB activator)